MKYLYSATDRGYVDIGWLKSHHSFSFGEYYNPSRMGWGPLRVINDDIVTAEAGFPMHPHRDMEIFSYVLKGSLTHEDTLGNKNTITPGTIQFMRAGSGIRHSEYNPSSSESIRLLQIWIEPREKGLPPGYQELDYDPTSTHNDWQPLLEPDDKEGTSNSTVKINQDTTVFRAILNNDKQVTVPSTLKRKGYLHLIEGKVEADDFIIGPGDALAIEDENTFEIVSKSPKTELLYFDLPA